MAKQAEVKIDAETLKNQEGELTEAQIEALADVAAAEVEAEKSGKPVPKEKDQTDAGAAPAEETGLTDDDLVAADDESLDDTQKAKKAEIITERKKKEDERLLAAKDEELTEEDKTRKAELVKTQQEAKDKEVEQEITAYAAEHSISAEEAKAELSNVGNLLEKYKNDPKQLAKALLHSEQIYGKLSNELKTLKDERAVQPTQDVTVDAVMKYVEDGKAMIGDKPVSKEQFIEAYRNANPDLTTDLDDDKVFVMAAKEYKGIIDRAITEQKGQLSIKAKEKRDSVLNSLSEANKQYLPTVKPLIERLSDAQVMSENFDIGTYITFAKGQSHDATVKRLEQEKKEFGEKEYQRGLSQAKILGEKRPPGGGGGGGGGKTVTLTEAQKVRAKEMFESKEITEEKACELYADLLKNGYDESK